MTPPPGPTTLAFLDVVRGVTLGTIHLVAFTLGAIWVLVNFYTFYPLAQSFVMAVADRLNGMFGTPAVEPTPDGGSSEAGEGPISPGDLLESERAPEIDVLIPAYEEATVIEQSIAAIRDARYPDEKLSLTVLLEPDDIETPAALEQLERYYAFDVVTVPERYPGESSKPRALDYGFERTDGDIVGVVDAEDVVDPDLFQEVARAIIDEGHTVVQGRLDMVNEDDGWLNAVFRAEFGLWFDYVLPAFNRTRYPVPLGGTTCFFRRSALVAMGVKRDERFGDPWEKEDDLWARQAGLFGRRPWSTQNVTEDFELGLFMWMDGHSVGYLDATTSQESPVRLDNWIRQRTRWEKGKLYTLLQFLRRPSDEFRANGHAAVQSGLPMLGPVNIFGVVLLFLLANVAGYTPGGPIHMLLSLGLAFVVLVSGLYGVGYWTATDKATLTRLRRTILVILTVPVYWLLQWGAAIRALYQMYNGWLHWERTTHNGRNGNGPNGSVYRLVPDTIEVEATQRVLALVAIVVVGVGVRAYALGSAPLWNDEIYSVAIRGPQSWIDLLFVSGEPHPPLYYLLLHGWMGVFGETPVSARSLSVLLAAGTLLGTYLLGRELFDEPTGLIGAFLVGISTYHIHFGRTARMYSLLAFLTVLSWYGFARLDTGSRRSVAGYLLATGAMVYTHVAGLLVVFAQWLYITVSESHGGISVRLWGRIQGVLLLGTLPVLWVLWQQVFVTTASTARPPLWWLQEPSRDAVVQTVLGYLGYPSHYPFLANSTALYVIAAAVLLLSAGALVLAIASHHPTYGFVLTAREGTAQMAVLFVVVLLVPAIFSVLVTPVFAPRYTLPASIALLLLVAEGILNLPDRRVQVGVLVFLAASSGLLIGGYLTADTVEPWDDVTERLESGVQAEDLVVVDPGWVEPNLAYYYSGPEVEMVQRWRSQDLEATLQGPVPPDRRIWLVHFGQEPVGDPVDTLAATHERGMVQRYGWISLYRFDPAMRPTQSLQHDARIGEANTQEGGILASIANPEIQEATP